MTQEELFEKYKINSTHRLWDNEIDSWFSIEIYRVMNNGSLPYGNDDSVYWVIEFLDKAHENPSWALRLNKWGSLYLTAKRMVYRYSEQILKEINNQ